MSLMATNPNQYKVKNFDSYARQITGSKPAGGQAVTTTGAYTQGKQRIDKYDPIQKEISNRLDGNSSSSDKKSDPIGMINALGEGQWEGTKGYNAGLKQADTDYYNRQAETGKTYLDSMSRATGAYKPVLQDLMNQAKAQADDSSKVYQGSIQPKLKGMLDADYKEAYGENGVGGAMSLSEAGDPNNKLMTSIRDNYNQQGANVQRQGLASSGVLGALGAQNAASAFGAQGSPMTVGQQQALYASSQGQAGQAFARAQQQMQNLRDQGNEQAFAQNTEQYNRGERAKGRAKDAGTQFADEEGRYQDRQSGYRAEQGKGAADMMGIDLGLAGATRDYNDQNASIQQGNIYNDINRAQGADNQVYGNRMATEQQRLGNANAAKAGQASMIGGITTAAGTVAGAYFGGPAGAMAGGAAGSALGNAMGGGAAGGGGGGAPSANYQQYQAPMASTNQSPYGSSPYAPNRRSYA